MSVVTGKNVMCCPKEISFRIKNRLIHVMETEDPSSPTRKPAKSRMVKEYSRSAAGRDVSVGFKVRGFQDLLTTTQYLIRCVRKSVVPWDIVYDFVIDRLRAVRQDMTIGRLGDLETMRLLELMLPFYFESLPKTYDRKLHRTQLEECISKWRKLHDKYRSSSKTLIACYLVHNCGTSWSIQLCYEWKEDLPEELWNDVSSLLLACKMRNAVGFFRIWNRLESITLRSAVYPLLTELRKDFLEALSLSYRGRKLGIPVAILADWIQLTPTEDLLKLLNEQFILAEKPTDSVFFFGSKLRN